jgi:hypothetical protein
MTGWILTFAKDALPYVVGSTTLATIQLSPLFAQVTGSDAPSIVQSIGSLTATGILGWYAHHTATRTIPSLVKDFREELAAEREAGRQDREAHDARVDRLAGRFSEALASERDLFREAMRAEKEHREKMIKKLDNGLSGMHGDSVT